MIIACIQTRALRHTLEAALFEGIKSRDAESRPPLAPGFPLEAPGGMNWRFLAFLYAACLIFRGSVRSQRSEPREVAPL